MILCILILSCVLSIFFLDFYDLLYQVSEAQSFWSWLERDLVPGLYNGNWYNNVQDTRNFLADRTNFLVGGARLRQLRVKKGETGISCYQNVLTSFLNYYKYCQQLSWTKLEIIFTQNYLIRHALARHLLCLLVDSIL